jgi:hypothetical protein
MSEIDLVASYLGRIIELRDQMVVIGEKMENNVLMPIALNGFTPS